MTGSLEELLAHVADESQPIRTMDLALLSDLPGTEARRFNQAWVDLSPARRLELIGIMVDQAELNIHLDFRAILRERLGDADERVRKLAIEGLWEDDRPTLVAPLSALLEQDPSSEVRAAAAASLGRFVLLGVLGELPDKAFQDAEAALRSAWGRGDETIEVRRRVLESLAYVTDPRIQQLIDMAYYDEDELMRQSAVFAMGRSADRRWANNVLEELNSGEPAMRFEAATSAGELGLGIAVSRLIAMMDDPDSTVREAAALALGKIGGRQARRALQAALEVDDERLAQAAEEALEELAFNSTELVDLDDGVSLEDDSLGDSQAEDDELFFDADPNFGFEDDDEPGSEWYDGESEWYDDEDEGTDLL